jgi:hypothetical protein
MLVVKFGGLGVVWTRQAVPFHLSASVGPVVLKLVPVAVHAAGAVHDTADSAPPGALCGSGTA